MKKIVVIGKSTIEKTRLLLYIAKGVHVVDDKSVTLVTRNQFYMENQQGEEYIEGVDIYYCHKDRNILSDCAIDSDYLIVDYEEIEINELARGFMDDAKVLILTNQSKEVIDYNNKILHGIACDMPDLTLLLHEFNDYSKVKEKQIISIFDFNLESGQILKYYSNLKDQAIMIDNGHNQCLAIKKFSSEFKKYLFDIISIIVELPEDKSEKKKRYKKLERGR